MQNNKFHYCLHILPILFFMAFVSASCIKDDLSDCPAPRTSGFSLQVKAFDADYNPQIQISAESETKRSIFRKRDKTKRSKKESAQHSKSRNKSFVMTSVSAL